jgi:ribosomal-protein-alanine N-acetyltransferase
MLAPPRDIRTKRLILRFPTIDDADAIFTECASDPEVARYMTWRPHESKETVVEFLVALLNRHESGEEFSWIVATPTEGKLMGLIGARAHGHMVDIGYVLGQKHWNRGLMTEAISAVSDWWLSQAGIFRVCAVCDTENAGSARVLEKSGFRREGLLSRWIIHPNLSSEPRDCYMYGRVR